jgi:nitrite reductase/ring-hydroxylating ferredoxin subunit
MIKSKAAFYFLPLLWISCAKEGVFLPDVPVNYFITEQEFKIKAVNNVLLVPNQGVAGLLLVYTAFGYKAYDRCSTVNPEARCKITPDEGSITATDPCTGAKFLLTDGSPAKAPAVRNLKAYYVNFQGQGLHITN